MSGIYKYDAPPEEFNNCVLYERNQNISVGYIGGLFYHMQFTGHYICKKNFHIKRRLEHSILLLFTVSGAGKLIYKSRSFKLLPGTVMFINTNIYHEYFPAEELWEFKYLHFYGGMSEEYQMFSEKLFGPVLKLPNEQNNQSISLLDRIFAATAEDTEYNYPLVSSYIYSILMSVLSASVGNEQSEPPSLTAPLIKAVSYIRANYRDSLDTERIAGEAGMTRQYFSWLFKRTYGISPHKYLTEYRLSIIKQSLISSDASISEIALSAGYPDVSAMSRIFKRENGISPSEYRANFRS